jgi:putative hemolysin
MLSRTPPVPIRLLDGFWPSARIVGLWPGIMAFGGRTVLQQPTDGTTLERLGALEVRCAHNAAEVRQAQKVRYQVFYREGGALADAATWLVRRDVDAFDAVCDHLLVIDHATADRRRARAPAVVGTYRLLRQEVAERHGGFYTAAEFGISALTARHRDLRFLELGRSCVLPPYRNKRTLELLWHGIASYAAQHRPDVMIGCASLDGTDPDRIALQLSYLHHYARAPEPWRARARAPRHVEMKRLPKTLVDPKAALRELPPLIKGYLRLGAYIGDGAVIDRQFGTTDVLIVLRMATIRQRYYTHFGAKSEREAASSL